MAQRKTFFGARGESVTCHDLVEIRDKKGKVTGFNQPCKPVGGVEILAELRDSGKGVELHVHASAVNKGQPVVCAICGEKITDATLALVPIQ